ncbi:hypothetical protein E5676_scaffold420G00430 [Cucumis melo var. makuwa]|uniref:Uncharacterized protein n=1 Tax=Cucumis melo var. makuwa TaxID=1194695 RepID=A0A5D3BR86_CUCMM|nr:hypothetical protein E5676_scaffold420G00430 [Cucumis melo var. makuwa]
MGVEIYGGGRLFMEFEASMEKSPWISISRVWRKVEPLISFKLGNGSRIAFWTDLWIDGLPLSIRYPQLFRIALLPNGSIAAHHIILIEDYGLWKLPANFMSNLSQFISHPHHLWLEVFTKSYGKLNANRE